MRVLSTYIQQSGVILPRPVFVFDQLDFGEIDGAVGRFQSVFVLLVVVLEEKHRIPSLVSGVSPVRAAICQLTRGLRSGW